MKPKKTEITGEAYYTKFANLLNFFKIFLFKYIFRLHMYNYILFK